MCPCIDQGHRLYTERLSQPVDHRKGRISFSPLNPADVCTVNVRPARQLLLGDAQGFPISADHLTERNAYVILVGHLNGCYKMLLDSLQTRSIILL